CSNNEIQRPASCLDVGGGGGCWSNIRLGASETGTTDALSAYESSGLDMRYSSSYFGVCSLGLSKNECRRITDCHGAICNRLECNCLRDAIYSLAAHCEIPQAANHMVGVLGRGRGIAVSVVGAELLVRGCH